jgi:uncharacterized membrane protein YeiH
MIAILDIIATFAFALVGARIAADHRMDYGGIFLIAIVASITGGTLRNLFLGERPIWLQQPWYFLAIIFAVLITIALRITRPVGKVVLGLDTLGLSCCNSLWCSILTRSLRAKLCSISFRGFIRSSWWIVA